MGVLTVGYTNRVSASDKWDFESTDYDPWDNLEGPGWDIGSENLTSMNSDWIQFEVLQTSTNLTQPATNLILGKILTNYADETISGAGNESTQYWLTPIGYGDYPEDENWSAVYNMNFWDPLFSPTNIYVAMTNASGTPGLFFGACYALDPYSDGQCPPPIPTNGPACATNYPLDYPDDLIMVDEGSYLTLRDDLIMNVAVFQFFLTNATTNWNLTISTNVTAHASYSSNFSLLRLELDQLGTGSGNASSSITIQSLPIQPPSISPPLPPTGRCR